MRASIRKPRPIQIEAYILESVDNGLTSQLFLRDVQASFAAKETSTRLLRNTRR